jgi:hypothetical protein
MQKHLSRIALLILALTSAPAAADWGPTAAEYSALITITDAQGETLVHRLYSSPLRQRIDYKIGGRDEIVIIDKAAGAVFVLYPQLKRYRKSPLVDPEFDFGIGRAETKREALGEEERSGLRATKYRVEARTAAGQYYRGLAWLTPERILVRLEGEVKHGRRSRRLAMMAREIKIGPLDPGLFQIPADYVALDGKQK